MIIRHVNYPQFQREMLAAVDDVARVNTEYKYFLLYVYESRWEWRFFDEALHSMEEAEMKAKTYLMDCYEKNGIPLELIKHATILQYTDTVEINLQDGNG